MEYTVKHVDEVYDINVEKKEQTFSINISGEEYTCQGSALDGQLSILYGNKVIHSVVTKKKGKYYIYLNGEIYELEEVLEEAKNFKAEDVEEEKIQIVLAPMPGKIIKTCVEEGEKVKSGQVLLIMESMKMETSVEATIDGIVKKLYVSGGDSMDDGQKLVEVEAEEEETHLL